MKDFNEEEQFKSWVLSFHSLRIQGFMTEKEKKNIWLKIMKHINKSGYTVDHIGFYEWQFDKAKDGNEIKRNKMTWIKIKDQDIDLDRIHLLVDGDTIYMRGTRTQPFFVQLCGEIESLGKQKWTHWMPLPSPPQNI